MPVLNFQFSKTNIEKTGNISPEDKIDNVLKIKKVEKEEIMKDKDQFYLKMLFEFQVNYGKIGKALLEGSLLFVDKQEKLEEHFKYYEDKKTLPKEIKPQIYNQILYRCNLKVLALSQDVNLPPHFQIPLVRPEEN